MNLLHWLVGCLLLVERDPSKRRVKPVEPHLLQLDFAGVGSSSDDSDFKVVTDDDSGSFVRSALVDTFSVELFILVCVYELVLCALIQYEIRQ